MAIAPTIGIFIYSATHSFDLLFWIALVVACLGWGIDATVKLSDKEIVKNKSKLSLDRFFLIRGWILGLNMVAFGFCFGVLSNYLAIYGKERLGISGGTGTYFMLGSIGLMLSRLQGGKALRAGRLTHNAGGGMLISLICYTSFIFLPTLANSFFDGSRTLTLIGYYGSAMLIGLGNGHMWPAFQNMTICVAQNNQRGTANSTILISWDIGMGLGILLGGIIAEHFGYNLAFWSVALVNAIGVALFFMKSKRFFLERNLNDSVR
jgi:MFS family permease